jgi:CRP/FNR family transcriptional regulator, cyclic AMP receptor protein
VVVTVIGAGSLIGELGLINDTARSATCIAASELAVGVLSRNSMKKMMKEEPELAARFLLAISSRLAERLRDTTTKLKKFIQFNAMLQNEVYMLMDAQDKLVKPFKTHKGLSRSEMLTEPMMLATQPAGLMVSNGRELSKTKLRAR